jgi:hypothetical protein
MFNVGTRDANLGQRKRSITRKLLFGPNSVKIVAFLLLAVFSLFYLSQSSQSATKTIQVSDLDQQEKNIMAEKERLEVEANRLKALSIIQQKASEKGMEQISN